MLDKLIVFVEEPSMEVALEQLLPKLMNVADYEIRRFQCKADLLKNLPDRLRAYRNWLPPTWTILVLVDRDDDDCHVLKQTLENMAAAAGLVSKTNAGNGSRFQVANRVAIEELEAWFFGDWVAVQAAYPRVSATIPKKSRISRSGRHSGWHVGDAGARVEAGRVFQNGAAQSGVCAIRGAAHGAGEEYVEKFSGFQWRGICRCRMGVNDEHC